MITINVTFSTRNSLRTVFYAMFLLRRFPSGPFCAARVRNYPADKATHNAADAANYSDFR